MSSRVRASRPTDLEQLARLFDVYRVFVLNDLFVAPAARRHGVARALMQAAHEHARAAGAVRVSLSTATDNHHAQRLYESMGYRRDEVFHHYDLDLG